MTSPSSPALAYRPDIDGMRAVAVLSVMAFHADARLVPGGFAGVDVFFVISGYLISAMVISGLVQRDFSVARFYGRRLARLAPALVIVLAATWVLGWFTLLPTEYEEVGKHIAAGAGFVSNIALWQEAGYFDSNASLKPLLHLWSLGVEEQFYLLWPAVLMLAWRMRINLLSVIAVVGAASFAVNVVTVGSDPSAAFYLPPSRFWQLLAGAALAYVTLARQAHPVLPLPRWWPAWRVALPAWARWGRDVACVALLVVVLMTLDSAHYPGWWAVLPTIWAVVTIAAGPEAPFNRIVLGRPGMVFVGLVSYPLYLWHWPLLTLARLVESSDRTWQLAGPVFAVAALLAWLTYRFVERPIRSVQRWHMSALVPAGLVLALAAVGAGGAAVHAWGRELPPRFPAEVQYLADFEYRYDGPYRERRCYLMPDQDREAFAPDCVDGGGGSAGPLVVLWGDSHAAHLYPGLQRLQRSRRFRVAQFTGSACPPLLAVDVATQPHCRDINDSMLARIRRLKPVAVLLAARWEVYPQDHLDQTVAAIKRVSNTRVVVLGPLPNWANRIPRILFDAVRRNPRGGVPRRVALRDGKYDRLDKALRQRALRLGAEYVSGYRILCDATGCLAKLSGGAAGLTTWDDHHLTTEGSVFVVERLADRLLGRQQLALAR